MKFKLEFVFIIFLFLFLFLFSCIYDPPEKGKEVFIYNQTYNPIIILDTFTENCLELYDTAIVNGRPFISRHENYLAEYGYYQKFYNNNKLNNLKKKGEGKIKFYIIDTKDVNKFNSINYSHSIRSFDINIDSLNKYDLNHIFITNDSIILEHDYNYITKR